MRLFAHCSYLEQDLKFYVGTSGWQYKHWDNGVFYPPAVTDKLGFYTKQFNAVEVNASFYSTPKPGVVAKWGASVPDRFKLVMKAPRSVSHRRWLKLESEPPVRNGRDLLEYFLEGVLTIPEDKRGPVLLQIQDKMKVDVDRLENVLDVFSHHGVRVAFEMRHPSWLADEVFKVLTRHNAALVAGDWATFTTPLVITGDWLYIRRHGPDPGAMYAGSYSDEQLRKDLDALASHARRCKEAYVFFNNDIGGWAPKNAATLQAMIQEMFPESV
jgi:uncharacterized protein YecE (DUF72 family)